MDAYIASITMFGGNFAPRAWALCNGQLLAINQNQALFSLLGTTYGGDGRTSFGLPDLRGRVAIHPGTGPGLSPYRLGQQGGQESVTLTVSNLPSHTHSAEIQVGKEGKGSGATNIAANSYLGDSPASNMYRTQIGAAGSYVKGAVVGNTGSNIPVNIRQPFLCVNYIICLQGIFPPRN